MTKRSDVPRMACGKSHCGPAADVTCATCVYASARLDPEVVADSRNICGLGCAFDDPTCCSLRTSNCSIRTR